MSIVRLLSPSLDLVDETIAGLPMDGSDLSSHLIVFPGKRPAHVVRKRMAEKRGAAFLPPSILSVDHFVDQLCREHLGDTTRSIEEIDAVALLYDLHCGLPVEERVGKEHFPSLETFYPVGAKIFTELEELTIALVTKKELTNAVSSVTLDAAHALARMAEPFYEEVRRRKLSTRAMRYAMAAERIAQADLSRYASITLAGFFALTPSETTILKHLATLRSVRFLFQDGEGIDTTLQMLGLKAKPEGLVTAPEFHLYESPDAHGQFFLLNTVLKKELQRPVVKSEEAVIVLPSSENLFPLYHQTLSEFGENEVNLTLGYPVSRTPVYGFLLSLMDVIVSAQNGEVFVPSYLQFLLHPYTKNILFGTRTDVTRALIHEVENLCLDQSARVFLRPEDLEKEPHLINDVVQRLAREEVTVTAEEVRAHFAMIHERTIRSLMPVRTLREFSDAMIGVLQFINEHSTAHRHPYFRPFVETIAGQFAAVRRSLLADHAFTKPEHFLLFLRNALAPAEVPFAGTPLQGLQILGFLETRGLKFRQVFLLDANDDVLPGKMQQDVLLPLVVRERLGLSTYREQERIKAYIFDILRRGAGVLHCFSVNNQEKEQSRFIARMRWEETKREGKEKPGVLSGQEYRIDLANGLPGPIAKSDAMTALMKEMPFSSTALDTYLTCGLRFYYKYVLRLREKGEVSGDVEASDIGKIVHAVLFEYFAPMKERPLTSADLDLDRLQRVITEQFRSFYGSTQFGEQFFTRRQAEIHLRQFIEEYQKPLLAMEPPAIEALEERFGAEIDGIDYTGNADRIEVRGDRTVIIDYKTGQSGKENLIRFDALVPDDRSTWNGAIGSLQLVLYVMLYSEVKKIAPETIRPVYLLLGKKDLTDDVEVPLFNSEEEQKEWYPQLRQIVLALTKEILDPTTPFQPTENPKSDCGSCAFIVLCGTQWIDAPRF